MAKPNVHHRDGKYDRKWHGVVDEGGTNLGAKPRLDIGCFNFQRISEEICLGLVNHFKAG